MPAKLFAVLAYVTGMVGAGLFFAFVIGIGTGFFPRPHAGFNARPALEVNFGLLLLFALQHSGMARQSIKKRLGYLGRSIYVAASGIAIGALTWFWQVLPGEPLWHGPVWIVAISLLAALGIGWCARFDHATFFGLTQAWTGKDEIRGPLYVDGPYRYVRHPLMLLLLIALWAQPIMPPELAMLNGGLTIYILMAIGLEERDLVREFGEEYERYRNKVPMLIPWKVFSRGS